MVSTVLRLGLLPLLCYVCVAGEATLEDSVANLRNSLSGLKQVVGDLSRHVMQMSFQNQERVRSEGSSGIVKVRGYTIGPNSYHLASHVGESFANMHDHANYEKLYGLGDFQAVINGVNFRTRHNDFEPRRASTTSKDWLATEAIESPPLPDGFTKKSIEDQIKEVREYIRAFKLQDSSIKPYQDFFKPVLCYLEGWWAQNTTHIEDGFVSIKHKFSAKSWQDLSDKARADAYLGSDFNLKHDGASLPVTILGVDDTTGLPIYAQWNYRVLCQPLKDDLPTAHLKPVEDLAYRQRRKISAKSMHVYRGSRFTVDSNPKDEPQKKMTMDELVNQVPGLDNTPGHLNETAFGRKYTGNLAYYNRAYPSQKDAMNSVDELRGFSDGNMYVALTTQKSVAPLVVTECSNSGKGCKESRIRCSWMFPLEIIYMSPLQRWNPYNLPHSSADWGTYAGSSTGKTAQTAYLGSHDRNFYRIPSKVYDILNPTDRIGADSYSSGRFMKNSEGVVAHLAPSGPRAILPHINGVGETRLRYPVAPLHEEGTGVWEELDGFIDYLSQQFSNLADNDDES